MTTEEAFPGDQQPTRARVDSRPYGEGYDVVFGTGLMRR